VWSLAFFFGWVLAFPYFGSVLTAVAPAEHQDQATLVTIFLLFHALGYLAGPFLLRDQMLWKKIMFRALLAMLIVNTALWFSPGELWLPGMALLGFVSSFYVLGWSYPISTYDDPKGITKVFIHLIIRANLITIVLISLSTVLTPAMVKIFIIAPLLAALWLLKRASTKMLKRQSYHEETKKPFPAVFTLILCLFIAGMFLNTGFMFVVIHFSYPIMEPYPLFLTYYKYIPYLLLYLAVLRFHERIQRSYLIYTGVSLLGLSFISFALLENTVGGYFLTITASEVAFALINIFIWTLLGELSYLYGYPFRFFGFGLFANIASTFTGGMIGSYLLVHGDSPRIFTAMFAATAVFLTYITIPWLNDQLMKESQVLKTQLPAVDEKLLEMLSREAALTPKETEIIALLLEGFSNQKVAGQIFISENTLKTHLRNIYRKFGVRKKSELLSQVVIRQSQRADTSDKTLIP
jgi:DNA-binding CsgD family transcriptional regulator/MFS family permease